jgi:hypothetical protein
MLSARRWARLGPIGALGLVSLMAPAAAPAQPARPTAPDEPAPTLPPPDPSRVDGIGTEAARLYLGQSLFALTTALRYARQAGHAGPIPGFDLAKFLNELELVTRGVERYLRPTGPAPAPALPVEITGQFLHDQLERVAPAGSPAR